MPVLLGAGETRETFAGLETWQIVLWYVLIAVSVAIFLFGVARLALKYRRGRTKAPVGNALERAVADDEGRRHARLDPPPRPAVGARAPARLLRLRRPLHRDGDPGLPGRLRRARLRLRFFWQGWFYLGYSLFLDVFGFALIVGLSVFAVKRGVLRPFRLSYWRPVEAAPAARGRGEALPARRLGLPRQPLLPRAHRLPARGVPDRCGRPELRGVGAVRLARRAGVHRDSGFEGGAAESARAVTWWVHGVFALFWVSSIPFTKAVHMLAGPAGVAAKDDRAGKTLLPLPANAKPEEVGYATIDALAPKHLLDLDACTKCGKCHAACPATAIRLPALAARPRPRPARGGRGLDGEPSCARHRAPLPRAR